MEKTSAIEVEKMFDNIAPRYDLTNTVLSFGLHKLWENEALNLLPKAPTLHVLDACTGTGALLPTLCKRYERVVGLDFSKAMLDEGKKLRGSKIEKAELVQGDATAMPFNDREFDIVTVAYGVRNLTSLERGLSEFRRVLKGDGHLLILEFGQPASGLWRILYDQYSKYVMPLIGGVLTGNRKAYEYLPKTANAFPCGKDFEQLLRGAGFKVITTKKFSGGIAYAYLASL